MRFMLITASNQLLTANRAKTAVIDIISLACNVPRLFIAICQCVYRVCVCVVCGLCVVCAVCELLEFYQVLKHLPNSLCFTKDI